MIELKEIALAYGARKIFDSVTVVVNKGDRIGLVGSNGAGKTTLLRVIAGEEQLDSGCIIKPRYATVGYLPQEAIVAGSRPLYDEVESAFADVLELRRERDEADEILRSAPVGSPEYSDAIFTMGEVVRKLEDAEESKLRSRVETVLHGLGFKPSDMGRPCSEFSGGWQMRIALAKLLLKEPSLLMLDEPTNHLDIESVAWLEDYLCGYEGAIIVVSHDRAFLNSLTNRTLHVSRGRIDSYAGNYDFFEKDSQARRSHLLRAAQNQQKAIEKTEKFIERFRYKATKAAQVQSRVKALDKIERIEVEEEDVSKISFRFPEPRRCGQVVLEVSGVNKAFGGHKVLGGISFRIERGEKVALVGVNGAGKSTLARIIAGELPADSGTVSLGLNVGMSYFAQHQSDELDRSNDVLTEALNAAPLERKSEVRGLLGAFLFKGDDVFKRVSVLSGGEKNRLALAKMLLKDFNFLILDEPTNHLDMNSKSVLQKALSAYSGTALIVSHDRDFLDPVVGKVMELSPSGLRIFPGNLSDYVGRLKSEGKIALRSPSRASGEKKVSDQKMRRIIAAQKRAEISKIKREIAGIESKISLAESDLAKVELEMSSPDFFKKGAQCASTTEHYNALKSKIDSLYADWEKCASELEMAMLEQEKTDGI